MKHLNRRVIKERSIRLSRVFRNRLNDMNENWKGWEGDILILHEGTGPNQVFGRNFAYKNVFVENFNGTYGELVKVRVNNVEGFNLFGKVI